MLPVRENYFLLKALVSTKSIYGTKRAVSTPLAESPNDPDSGTRSAQDSKTVLGSDR